MRSVETWKYVASHGKLPRGTGTWWFSIGNYERPRTHENREVAFRGSYTEAKKKALKAAKKYGYSRIYVLP